MKKYLAIFVLLSAFIFAKNISWQTDFNKSMSLAKASNKKIFLFFTGSDFCPWCVKFDNEILKNQNFIDKTKDTLVFQYVDFPAKKQLPKVTALNNKVLKQRYKVRGLPTVVIVDAEGNVIKKMGYLPIGGDKYADKVNKIISDYKKVSFFDKNEGGPSLKKKYDLAKKKGFRSLEKKILKAGVSIEDDFFLLEKYSLLLEKNESDKAKEIRNKLIEKDPHNLKNNFLKIALLQFESNYSAENMEPLKVVASLVEYINNYGKEDKSKLWQINMIISQYLASKNQTEKALFYARESFKTAPHVMRDDLVKTIRYLKSKINSESITKNN